MTCPPKSDPRHRNGFTLIEIVIVLAIIGVITGSSIAAMILTSSERKLRNASSEVELLAKKARTAAILSQTPYAIEFHAGSVRLMPLSQASEIERTTALGNSIGGEAVESSGNRAIHGEISIDPDIKLSVRRWNTTEFIVPDDEFVPIWRFDPDGLSEPITVRFTMDNSYAQDTYHPLTATIADSELEAN
jgi:prepilin-type N-terminal cleavage/methylation domain-containing protein